jgi:protein-export membrane protein SecD
MRHGNKSNIRSKVKWGIIGIFVLLVVSGVFVYPRPMNAVIGWVNSTMRLGIPLVSETPFKLGLDLQGGAHLVYEADMSGIPETDRDDSLEGVRDVIERRVGGIGVSEPLVQTSRMDNAYRLTVDLPGIDSAEQAATLIGQTPILEFKELNSEPPRELTAEEQRAMDAYNVDAKKRADAILKRARGKESFEDIAKEVSEDESSKVNGGYLSYVNSATTEPEIYAWAASSTENAVSTELVATPDGYNILKRGGVRDGGIEVLTSHILVCYLGAVNCENPLYNKDEAAAKAQELYDQATGDNFTTLALENSTDPTVSLTEGSLGWIGKGITTPEFETPLFEAGKGQIIGPIETPYGYHVIYKQDERIAQEYEVFRILIETQVKEDIVPPVDQWKDTGLSGKQLARSEVVTDPTTGSVQVALNFNEEGTQLFSEITERNLGKQVAIFLDGEIISAPTVQVVIRDGQAVITGSNDIQEARLLTQRLNAGALPVPVELVSQQTVGASLGQESVALSVKAGVIGVFVVMLFMILYYRLPGVLSVVSLALYILVTLALFKFIGVTLTLAGIAGFILSIGMAVDANVLIFERMKEELERGKSLKVAVEEGFKRAWTSIRDGNVSTLITCALLIWLGTSFVKGFAVALIIGILVSMFSAITVTRVMLRFVVPWFKERDGGVLFLGSNSTPDQQS